MQTIHSSIAPARRIAGILAGTFVVASVIAAPAVRAAQVTYDYVDVNYLFGNGSSLTFQGSEQAVNVSTNGPGAAASGTIQYGYGALAIPGTVASGTWDSATGGDSLHGSFQTLTAEDGYAGSAFTRYTGTRTVEGGTGYFAGATGTGSFEFYAVYYGTGDPNTFAYQGIAITRMSVTVETDAPRAQPDQRPVYVLVKNGVENLVTGEGVNGGIFTSASPGLIPWETEEAAYTFQPLPIAEPPFVGTFTDVNANGSVSGAFVGPGIERGHLGTFFNYAPGSSTTTGGTGDYAGATGSSTYEAFSYSLGGIRTEMHYSNVVAVRVGPVPEASTWVMMLSGLGLLAFLGRRRLS